MARTLTRLIVAVLVVAAALAVAVVAPPPAPASALDGSSLSITGIDPVDEGDANHQVTVSVLRDGPVEAASIVDYETSDGTATASANDFVEKTGTLNFLPGVALLTIQVTIIGDDVVEPTEAFRLSLTDVSGEAIISPNASFIDIQILDDDVPPQDFHVNVSTQPPASAQVGDTVSAQYTISVDAGADPLTVFSVASGAGTTGLNSPAFPSPPTSVAAGTTSSPSTASARVVAAPGTSGVHLQVVVNGELGAVSLIRSADTNTIASTEAVTAVLADVPATVTRTDQITYTLTLTNSSDTPAQLTGLPAGLPVPAGTTVATSASGSSSVAGNGSTVWTLVVDVDDADANGFSIVETPTGVSYAMIAIALAARQVPISPNSATSTVSVPAAQSFHVNVSQQPPTSAQVGDTVTAKFTITVDSGASALAVTNAAVSAGTVGLDLVAFSAVPTTVVAGATSPPFPATARVVAMPGTAGVHLQVSVNGTLASVASTQTADTAAIASTEAVAATLTGGPSTVARNNQITYTLTLSNNSDTPAQLAGLPAGLAPPSGTTLVSRTNGPTTVPANSTSVWKLIVKVNSADANGFAVVQTPTGVSYAMSALALPARAVAVAPASVTSTVVVAPPPQSPLCRLPGLLGALYRLLNTHCL